MPKQTYFNLPEDKRETFLVAAINEFADNDYPNASISRVCKTAGIAKGSFYQYFEDKKDLLLYLIQLMLEEKQELVESIELPEPDLGFFDSLRSIFTLQVGYNIRHPRLAEVAYRAFYGALPFKDEMIESLKQAGIDAYSILIEKGVNDASLRSDIDVEAATFVISTVFAELGRYLEKQLGLDNKALVIRSLTDEQWEEASRHFDGILRLLEFGMRNDP